MIVNRSSEIEIAAECWCTGVAIPSIDCIGAAGILEFGFYKFGLDSENYNKWSCYQSRRNDDWIRPFTRPDKDNLAAMS